MKKNRTLVKARKKEVVLTGFHCYYYRLRAVSLLVKNLCKPARNKANV